MIRTGEVIENPVTGETMVFLQTAEETGGELLRIALFVAPGGAAVGEHMHPRQEERFEVRRGEMTVEVNGERRVIGTGETIVIAPGTPHVWWNSGDEELSAVVELSPAGRLSPFIETMFGLAKMGHVDEHGLPGILQAAVTLREFRDTVVMTRTSPVVREYILPVIALLGRMLGLRAVYPYPRRSRVNRGMEIWAAA